MANKKIKEELTAVTEKAAAICENRKNIQPREPLAALCSRKVHIINGLLDLLEAPIRDSGINEELQDYYAVRGEFSELCERVINPLLSIEEQYRDIIADN